MIHSGTVRVACINDLSGYGRCSLTTAIAVLSVMGVQPCPVPTAVFSKHTGFPTYHFTDYTDAMPAYLENWSDLVFDQVYSGFLGSMGQIAIVQQFIRTQKAKNPACQILLDTVMGDHGSLYSTYTSEMCQAMRELIRFADVITPNITEACFLTGTPYHGEALHTDEAVALCKQLLTLGCQAVVLTGIVREDHIATMTYTANSLDCTICSLTKCRLSGTGDLFASVLSGAMAQGKTLADAVAQAAAFVSDATQYTLNLQTSEMEGICFEPILYRLHNKEREHLV